MFKKLLAPAVLLAFAPAVFAQTLSLNPFSMQFQSGGATSNNVVVTAPGGAVLALTAPVITYTLPIGSTAQWLTVGTGNTGQPIAVTVFTAPGGIPLTNGSYHADVRFSTSTGLFATLPIDLLITGSTGGGGSTTVATPGTLNFSSTLTQQTFTLNATSVAQSYNISVPLGTTWLSVSPTVGTTIAGVPTTIGVTVFPSLLQFANSTTLTVTVGSQSQQVIINYASTGTGGGGGTVGGVTLSTTQLSYFSQTPELVRNDNQFTLTTSIGQYVELRFQNNNAASTWLALNPNNVTTQANVPVTVGVFIDSRGLGAGTYTGSIGVYQGGTFNLLGTINVSLTVGASGGVSPSRFDVSAPFPATVANVQSLNLFVSANNKQVSVTPSTTDFGAWLTGGLSPTTIATSVNVPITINPTGLPAGVYSGKLTVTISGSSNVEVPVTLIVGSGVSGTIVNPNPITMSAAAGSFTSQQFTLNSPVNATYQIIPSGVTWLTFSSLQGQVFANQPLTLTANGNAATAGLINGLNTTSFQVTFPNSNVVTQTVTVNFTVGSTGGGGFGSVSPTSIPFSSIVGGSTQSNFFTINGTVGSSYSISSNATWLTLGTSASGTLPSNQFTVSTFVNPSSPSLLSAGTYNGTISVFLNGVLSGQVSVTLTVGGGGSGSGGSATPTALSFNSPFGGAVQTQTLTLLGTALSQYQLSSSSVGNWLSTGVSQGIMPSNQYAVNVSANPVGLSAGTYSGTIQATVSGVSTIVSVTLTIGGGGPVSPGALTFNTPVGVNPSAQILQISSSNFANYTAVASNAPWLTVTPNQGTISSGSSASVSVSVNVSGLAATTYNGSIIVTIGGQSYTVPVTLIVGGSGGSGLASPSSMVFSHVVGNANPGAQVLTLQSPGGVGTQNTFSIDFPTATWLSVSSLSGTAPTSVNVNVVPGSLAPGSYNANLTVRFSGGLNVDVPITLNVQGTGGSGGVGTGNQVLSHIADSAGWQTSVILVNLDTQPAPYSLRFFGSQTTGRAASAPLDMSFVGLAGRTSLVEGTIPAGGTRIIQTSGTDAQLNMGWAELTTSRNIKGSGVFRDTVSRQEAAVNLTQGFRAFLLPFDNSQGRVTSFALINTNPSQAITVTATIRDETGVTLGTASIALQARGHIATETTTQFTASAGQRGSIEFSTANPDISGLGIRFDAPSTTGGARPFTSFPVLPR